MDLFEHLGSNPSFCEAIKQRARTEVLNDHVQTAARVVGYDFVSMKACVCAFQCFASLLANLCIAYIPTSH
jgi:hypothetical protein